VINAILRFLVANPDTLGLVVGVGIAVWQIVTKRKLAEATRLQLLEAARQANLAIQAIDLLTHAVEEAKAEGVKALVKRGAALSQPALGALVDRSKNMAEVAVADGIPWSGRGAVTDIQANDVLRGLGAQLGRK
jgi:hypothetical protein